MASVSSPSEVARSCSLEEHFEVTGFLNREARLLDERRYRDWLDLLTDDIEYLAPLRRYRQSEGVDDDWAVEKELSREGELPLTVNRYAQLKLRVDRLLSGKAHTENPPWFTQRLITNVEARHAAEPGTFEVDSKFLVNRFKMGREQTIVGSRRDVLVRVTGGFQLCRRVVLYNADSYRWGAYVLI